MLLPLEFQKFVIAAARRVRVGAADGRPGFIDGAAALLGIEKAAGRAEMLVLPVAQHLRFLSGIILRELLLGLRIVQVEMPRQPGDVAFADFDQCIAAAIGRAFAAVVAQARFVLGSGDCLDGDDSGLFGHFVLWAR